MDKRIDVYELLRDKIIQGEVPPGQAITEEWLSGQLNVSRTPIREALIRLQADGLVTLVKNKGAFVTPFTITDIVEILRLRTLLEGFAARSCVDFIPHESIRAIHDRLEGLAKTAGNLDEKAKAGMELHALIADTAGNARLKNIITTLQAQFMWVRFQAALIPGRVDRSLREHVKTAKAILAGDRNGAERYMKKHMENVFKDLVDPKNLKNLTAFPATRSEPASDRPKARDDEDR